MAALFCHFSVVSMAATPDEAASACAQKMESAKNCCIEMLDASEDIQQCTRQTLDLRYAKSPQSTLPSTKTTSTRQSGTQGDTPPGRTLAKFRIGDRFEPHDLSHLPIGSWMKDWPTSMSPASSLAKEYGAKPGDIKQFEKKLYDISSIIKEIPVLNPPRGCAPRLSRAIADVYDARDKFSKQQPIRGQLIAGCFKLLEVKAKKNDGAATKWEINEETRQYNILLNDLNALLLGTTWTEGPSSIRPLDQVFTKPTLVGELQGFPIYARHITPQGDPQFIFTLISRKSVEPFLPVSREHFIKALINSLEHEINSKYYDKRDNPPYGLNKNRAGFKKQLESLKPEEKDLPACLQGNNHEFWGQKNVPIDTPGCEPIVRINPALLNLKALRSAVQFVVIRGFEDIQEKYNSMKADKKDAWSNFRVTMDMIIQTDWNKVYNLIDKP